MGSVGCCYGREKSTKSVRSPEDTEKIFRAYDVIVGVEGLSLGERARDRLLTARSCSTPPGNGNDVGLSA